jgi:diaminohydroxyphosphoribosylaminopyrimidine deaminase/5-amino-6-(5-phosphoribosylamino)uracil reductase
MPENKDQYFMSIALKEAKKGLGYTSPNPLVGAVIVKNNKIISTGYHKKYGFDHAEVDAIKNARNANLKNSSIYVNLEPCSHTGNTPPCVNAIIKAGIKKVFIAEIDPDERVNGNGIKILKKAGITVKTGIMNNEAKKLNSIYYYYKENKKPYIVLKTALTLDGKIATHGGDAKWISNETSRKIAHQLRLRLKSIAVGKNTIVKDKPQLNCRLDGFTDKAVDKLIFSSRAINTDCLAPNDGKVYFIDKSISRTKRDFINFCLSKDIDSILVEGGGELITWFLKNDFVDRIFLFYKPSFLGADGISVFLNKGVKQIRELEEFNIVDVKIIDNNFMVELSRGEPICLQA